MAEEDFGRPFFHIDGELDPSLGEPTDGFAFLKSVRWEANRLEQVNVSNVDPTLYDRKQTRTFKRSQNTSATTPTERLPSNLWRKSLLKTVHEHRETYFRFRQEYEDEEEEGVAPFKYPEWKDEKGWLRFFFGEGEEIAPQEPLISHLIRFDEVSIIKFLKLHVKWSNREDIEWSASRFQWLFSLLICLDLPIDAAMQADLFRLRQVLCSIRSTTEHMDEPKIAGLNTVITLLEDLFGQRDC